MIQKLGNAMKKMAQRSMMRGNRGDAQAINSFGLEGMRSNLQTQPQNVITQHPGANIVSSVNIKETQNSVKTAITGAKAGAVIPHGHHTEPSHDKKLGQSLLDALQ